MNFETMLGTFATLASAWEVQAGPKPGLVDPFGSGAHDDMDYVTFLLSTCALASYWKRQARVGLDGISPGKAMAFLRPTGLEMESAMARATGGVNTHKGLIYAMSLLLYGAGCCLFSGLRVDPCAAARIGAESVSEIVREEFSALSGSVSHKSRSHGERLFLELGVKGIRGEASSGFPSVLGKGLPALWRSLEGGAPLNDSALCAFFSIASVCEDSNVIIRGGYDFWKDTHLPLMEELSAVKPPYDAVFFQKLHELDRKYSSLGVSPGGAADLLSCTLFLHWAQLVNKFELS